LGRYGFLLIQLPLKFFQLFLEIGAALTLLASDAASAVTGQVISVDGGFMI